MFSSPSFPVETGAEGGPSFSVAVDISTFTSENILFNNVQNITKLLSWSELISNNIPAVADVKCVEAWARAVDSC